MYVSFKQPQLPDGASNRRVAAQLVCPRCQGRLQFADHTCDGCNQRFKAIDGVVILDDSRVTVPAVSHLSPPLEHSNDAFTRLSFYQLIQTIKSLDPNRTGSILIVGCGTGREFELASRACNVISGVDISLPALRAAAEEHTRLGLTGQVVLFDGRTLPYPDRSFDLVMAHHVLHHVDNPLVMLGEMWRVCRYEVILHEPARTRVRAAIVWAGLRPRVEEDGSVVKELAPQNLREFAAARSASLMQCLCIYPKPLGARPGRVHRLVDFLRVTPLLIFSLELINLVAGRIIGTKVTARFMKVPLPNT